MIIDPEKVRPPHTAFFIMVCCMFLQYFLRPDRIIERPYHLIGLAVFFLGIAVMSWAYREFIRGETPVEHNKQPTRMIAAGLYRFSRNPMYVGGLLIFSGIAIFVGTWPFLLFPALTFIVLDRIYVPWEENLMEELFGDNYRQYKKKVPRWFKIG